MSWEWDVSPALAGFSVPGETPELRALALGEAARVVFERVIAAWPVATGLSLAGFRTSQEGGTWYVRNPVDYAPYVHSHPNQGGPPGLADRAAAAAMPAAAAVAKRELVRVVEVSQVVGKRGAFRLVRRTLATAPEQVMSASAAATGMSPAIAEVSAVVAEIGATPPLGVPFLVSMGQFGAAADALEKAGYLTAARRILAIAARRAA